MSKEKLKIFLVKENLVLVEGKAAVCLCATPALCDSKEVILCPSCRFYIKKISAFTSPYGFGINIIALFFAGESSIIIFPIHIFFFNWNPILVSNIMIFIKNDTIFARKI